MSEMQTKAIMCENCAHDNKAEYYTEDYGHMCIDCYNSARVCPLCFVEYYDPVPSEGCEECQTNDDPLDEVKAMGWDHILHNTEDHELSKYAKAAGNWHSCAVGEILGFNEGAEHLYSGDLPGNVEYLGNRFHDQISEGQGNAAIETLAKIREHTEEIKKAVG